MNLPDFASLPANDITAIVLILCGVFFFFTSTLGLLRFPDLYSRMHATGKGDTLAVLLILAGAVCHHGFNLNSAKLLLIATFVFIANPTATHALGRAAYRCGIKPWVRRRAVASDATAADPAAANEPAKEEPS